MELGVELIFVTISFYLVTVASLRCSPTREKIYTLKYFRGYGYTMKIIYSKILYNEINPDEKFPDYGISVLI